MPGGSEIISQSRDEGLEAYESELVRCLQYLRRRRDEVSAQIVREEEDRTKIQREIKLLNDRLRRLQESITVKTNAREEYDKTIAETEAAYNKIMETAHTLVNVLRREQSTLDRRVTAAYRTQD